MNLLDWRLRHARENAHLPDLPEVRRLMRLSWWNGFTFGAMEHQVARARKEALAAMARHSQQRDDGGVSLAGR